MPEDPLTDESIFGAAAALPPDRRATYLDEACGADAARRARVEGLLRSHEEAGSFLEGPPVTTEFVPLTESAGSVIGRYKLLQQIGEGGFGVVYMAEQKEPVRRKVALKIIKLGMDSKEVIARFEAERQALALMDHPNIAKVLDAGATDAGRPYFVMELVKGVPIVEFCDRNQLPARERLPIFMAVCQAVQHAHQKGIIHRDIKPSNVLVTLHDGKPVPKVIDFGVAKALNQELTEKTLFTAFGHMIGTPQYMSPEQAEMSGLDVDTRSDVYSLGVLLYELLTGTTPLESRRLRSAGYAEMQRLIREEEAPRPSTRLSTLGERLSAVARDRQCDPKDLQRLVRGELDWIVMKALEKDRGRRYETATSLAKDVERYLAGDTVEACPPSAGYRLRKFARKYRKGLVVAAAFALPLLAAWAISSWEAVRAIRAEGDLTQKSNALIDAEAQARAERDDARGARDELRRNLYVTRANLIQAAWGSDNMARVLQLLDQQRPQPGEPDLRGFEWHYYQRLAHADLRTIDLSAELSKGVMATLLSPDGSRLAAVTPLEKESTAARLRVWELRTGKELFSAPVDFGDTRISFSRDGKRLAVSVRPTLLGRLGEPDSGRKDGRLEVWDCDTGKELFTRGGDPLGVALSADGRRVAGMFPQDRQALPTGGNTFPPPGLPPGRPGKSFSFAQNVQVWDVDSQKEIGGFPEPGIMTLAFSPDGDHLAATYLLNPPRGGGLPQPEVRLWKVGGKERWTARPGPAALAVEFSPDGSRLACSTVGGLRLLSGETYALKVYNAADGKEAATLTLPAPVRDAAFSPDGKRLAGGAGPNVLVCDLIGTPPVILKGHTAPVAQVVFSADGTRLISLDSAGVVKVWAAPALGTPEEPVPRGTTTVTSPDGSCRLSYTGGGPSVFGDPVAGANVIKVLDRAGKPLCSFEGHTGGVMWADFSPDGRHVVSQDRGNNTLLWEAATGKQRLSVSGGSLSFSAAGNRVVGYWFKGGIKVWDAKTFEERFSLSDRALPPALSPDGRRLLVRVLPGEPGKERPAPVWKLWDVDNARLVATIPCQDNYLGLPPPFDPSGKHLAIKNLTDITIWDPEDGSRETTLQGTDPTERIVMNAGGTLLAAIPRVGGRVAPGVGLRDAGEAPAGVAVWDVAAGKVRYRLKGHSARVWDVAFSPDGKRIATLAAGGGRVGEVKLWDTATGAELLELKPDVSFLTTALSFSADGTRLTASSFPGGPGRGSGGNVQNRNTWDATPLPEK